MTAAAGAGILISETEVVLGEAADAGDDPPRLDAVLPYVIRDAFAQVIAGQQAQGVDGGAGIGQAASDRRRRLDPAAAAPC